MFCPIIYELIALYTLICSNKNVGHQSERGERTYKEILDIGAHLGQFAYDFC